MSDLSTLPRKNGWRDFFHSPLFAGLVVFGLGQGLVASSFMIASYWRTSQLLEWKGGVDAKMERFDREGTLKGRDTQEQQSKDISDLQARVKTMENEGRHWEVIETEHRRLTKDVEDLQHVKR